MSEACEPAAKAPSGDYVVEFTVTAWHPSKGASVIAGPWIAQVGSHDYLGVRDTVAIPLRERAWEQVLVDIQGLTPSTPGWLGGSMELIATDGAMLTRRRPFSLFASPSDVASNTNLGPAYDETVYTVQARVVRPPAAAA